MDVNIEGLDRAELLAALYNSAKPLGMGLLHFVPGDMPIEEAQSILDGVAGERSVWMNVGGSHGQWLYFDYLKGRVIKCDLGEDEMRTDLYNRDNGRGAAEGIVKALRAKSVAQ